MKGDEENDNQYTSNTEVIHTPLLFKAKSSNSKKMEKAQTSKCQGIYKMFYWLYPTIQ